MEEKANAKIHTIKKKKRGVYSVICAMIYTVKSEASSLLQRLHIL